MTDETAAPKPIQAEPTRSASDAAKWMKASVAFKMLERHSRNPVEAAEILASYLRNGRLRAKAGAVWVSDDKSLTAAWRSGPEVGDPVEIPVKFWRADVKLLEDRATWRWPSSQFHITLRNLPKRRRMMRKVEFLESDLRAMQPEVFGAVKKPRRGKAPEIETRDAGWLRVVEILLSGKTTRDAFPTQAEFQAEIHDAIAASNSPPIGQNTIRDIVRLAWIKMR